MAWLLEQRRELAGGFEGMEETAWDAMALLGCGICMIGWQARNEFIDGKSLPKGLTYDETVE